jgi:hypothetical protein
MKKLLVMLVWAAVAGSASAAYTNLVPTTTYTREDNDYTWVLDKVRETDAKMRGEQPLSLASYYRVIVSP